MGNQRMDQEAKIRSAEDAKMMERIRALAEAVDQEAQTRFAEDERLKLANEHLADTAEQESKIRSEDDRALQTSIINIISEELQAMLVSEDLFMAFFESDAWRSFDTKLKLLTSRFKQLEENFENHGHDALPASTPPVPIKALAATTMQAVTLPTPATQTVSTFQVAQQTSPRVRVASPVNAKPLLSSTQVVVEEAAGRSTSPVRLTSGQPLLSFSHVEEAAGRSTTPVRLTSGQPLLSVTRVEEVAGRSITPVRLTPAPRRPTPGR